MPEHNRLILIVDEDDASLSSFKRLFRQRKPQWEVLTKNTANSLKDLFLEHYIDAVIYNISGRERDELTLLKEIKRISPSTCRIVITTTLEEGASLASLGIAHQYIQKPFNSDLLFETLQRSFDIRDAIGNPAVKDFLGRLEALPSLPSLYLELVQRLNDPDCSPRDIANIISKDPGMTIKVLQLVNSAYFGIYSKVTDPVRAVTILGIDMIKSLALAYGIFKQMAPAKVRMCKLEGFWSHSISVADLCRVSGLKKCLTDTICQNDAFTAGLIHDIGKLVLADNMPREYSKVLQDHYGPELAEIERRALGASHAEVGACILGLWALPDNLVEAVLWHHGPFQKIKEAGKVAQVVYLADLLVRRLEGLEIETSLEEMLEFLGLSDSVDELLRSAKEILMRGKDEGL